jgi:hypothetical protein
MNINFKIGDRVKDPKWGMCEIGSEGSMIESGEIAYVAIPLEERYKGWGKFYLLEKDLELVK